MWFSSWLCNRNVSPKRRPASRFRPAFEVLEERAVPATLIVNTTLDVLGHANGMLSLRQAVIDANARTTPDTIVIPAGNYVLTRTGQETVANDGLIGDLDINSSTHNPLTISGAGAGTTVIDAGGQSRVFKIYTGDTVLISGLTIKGGNAANGGGIANWHAPLTVSDCIFSRNSASGPGGGAIMNFMATMTVNHCTFSNNFTNDTRQNVGNGGAILNYSNSTMTVSDSTFIGNSAHVYGGGIYNGGTLTVSNSTFSGNTAQYAGGIANMAGSTMTVSNCILSSNSSSLKGGGIFNLGTLTIRGSTVSGNFAPIAPDLMGTASLFDTTIGGIYYP